MIHEWATYITDDVVLLFFSCKEPVEPLTLDEVAERCHAEEDVCIVSSFKLKRLNVILTFCYSLFQIEMIYKIIAHMAANDRALIAEGSCGSPRSIKVFLGECNVDESHAWVQTNMKIITKHVTKKIQSNKLILILS